MSELDPRLDRLLGLYHRGVLTREEFEAERKRLLEGASGGASPPRRVGAYWLERLIATGGMGEVWEGRHRLEVRARQQGGHVAIKLIRSAYARSPRYREEFEREAATALQLVHPNIVRVFDLIVDGEVLALVMERVEGQSLAARLDERTGPWRWRDLRGWTLGLLDGLDYLHGEGLVHRDLKPSNILIDPAGQPRIIDLGIARPALRAPTSTRTVGTPRYMAPEQWEAREGVDGRADLYALGVILFECLVGTLPWPERATPVEVLARKSRGGWPPLCEVAPRVPKQLGAIIDRLLQVEPSRRFATAHALARALRAVDEPPRGRTEGDMGGRGRRAAGALVVGRVLVGGLLVGGLLVGLVGSGSPGIQPVGSEPVASGPVATTSLERAPSGPREPVEAAADKPIEIEPSGGAQFEGAARVVEKTRPRVERVAPAGSVDSIHLELPADGQVGAQVRGRVRGPEGCAVRWRARQAEPGSWQAPLEGGWVMVPGSQLQPGRLFIDVRCAGRGESAAHGPIRIEG